MDKIENCSGNLNLKNEIDQIFMVDVWEIKDLHAFQEFSRKAMEIFVRIVAELHGLSYRQGRFLTSESTEIAIAAFCDTLYRLNKCDRLSKGRIESDLGKNIRDFIVVCSGRHPGFSRKLRGCLANLIFNCYGSGEYDISNMMEPEISSLEDLLKNETIADQKYELKFLFRKDPLNWISKRARNLLYSKYPKRFRIGISRPSMFDPAMYNLVGFDWVPVDWPELNEDLTVPSIQKIEFYSLLLESFQKKVNGLELPIAVQSGIKADLMTVLFAVLIATTSPNVVDKEKLKVRLQKLKSRLKPLGLQAVISKGGWGNGLLAAAAIEIELPLIMIQMGGGYGVFEYNEGHYGVQLNDVDHFLGYGWIREKTGLTACGNTHLHKMTDPELSYLGQLGRKRKKNNYHGRILFSPFVHSCLYRTELWIAYYPENALRMRRELERSLTLFKNIDGEYDKYEFYIKLKAFSYQIFSGYEYLFGMIGFPTGTKKYYLTKETSQRYFPYFQLHVIDSISTGLMLSLVYNMPTVAYWDKKAQYLTAQAEPVFCELVKQGIVATNAEEMAESMKKFMHYPEEWARKDVQEIRHEFIEKFARANNEWEKEFTQLMDAILLGDKNG